MNQIRKIRKGTYFTLKLIEHPAESQVWVRGLYDPSLKAYECCAFDDISRTRYFKGSRTVYTDFIF